MAADRSSNANQLRFLIVGKCSAKATKQLCCCSFDNVLTQSWIRNIKLCCSCSYGHWTFCLLQSLLSLQLALLIHSNSLFLCVFCTCKSSRPIQFTTRSSAVAKRPRDASCLQSVVSFVASIVQAR